ncbi:MAG TPA: IPT/TIG domain-containing protein [Longimicrobiales bacterium]|nr:IPT/TIG domain-containing protein [Longimicrobiales bacterium]
MRWRLLPFLATLCAAACGDNAATGPQPVDPATFSIAVQAGDNQFVGPGSGVTLQAVVKNGATKAPARGVSVTWTVTDGVGASVSPATSVTDTSGIAATQLTVGTQPGAYHVQATFQGIVGAPAAFTVTVTTGLTLSAIAPQPATAGDTVTITGQSFSTSPLDNLVLFGGIRGAVASATPTTLRVVVPACVPSRSVQVQVFLGTLASTTLPLAVVGGAGTAQPLTAGQVLGISDPAALACVRLPGGQTGASYLVVVQNAATLADRPFAFQLAGLAATAGVAAQGFFTARSTFLETVAPTTSFATEWENRLREKERGLARGGTVQPSGTRAAESLILAGCARAPAVGDQCSFNVLNAQEGFTTVTATVRAVSTHAIVYQDVNAPSGGFTDTEFQQFAATFDDPIYDTDVSVYGAPSDLDANGKVVILFTPVVNQLTPRGSSSFIAGFFYGCDLLPVRSCSGSNQGEVFYALVPDPTGQLGLTQSKTRVLQTVPPVLAHEFMHMIHFNQRVLLRGGGDESLWLSEALAHTAEDTVGGVFLQRGDSSNAVLFKFPDFRLGHDYLENPSATTLLADSGNGSLEERGAGWLFVKYLIGRFGGDVPGRLVKTTRTGADNVSNVTGTQWPVLFQDWTVALWVDDAPELAGASIDPRYTFRNFDLRRVLGQPALGDGYPLVPTPLGFTDFTASGTLPSSSPAYYLIQATASNPPPLNLNLAGSRGAAFATSAAPQAAIVRVK